MRRRRILLGTIVLAIATIVAWALFRVEPTWRDDISDPEPPIEPPDLRFARILELSHDYGEFAAHDVDAESFAVFDRDYMWLSGIFELTRVPLDGGPIKKIAVSTGIRPGSVGVVDDRVLWMDGGGEGRSPALLYGVPRSLDQSPSVVADLSDRWGAPPQRPLHVGGHIVLFGVYIDDNLFPEAALAAVPAAGGEPRIHRLDALWCNEGGALTSVGDAVVIACATSEFSSVDEIVIPSFEHRAVRRVQDLQGYPWSPRSAVVVDDALILVGDADDGWGFQIKRLHPDGRLQTLTSVTHDEQTFGVLRGDGHHAFYYCRQGGCGTGRLFWFGAEGWAELPDAPRNASRIDLSAGVLHWQQREDLRTVLYASTAWPRPPVQAVASHNPHGVFFGVQSVHSGSSGTPR